MCLDRNILISDHLFSDCYSYFMCLFRHMRARSYSFSKQYLGFWIGATINLLLINLIGTHLFSHSFDIRCIYNAYDILDRAIVLYKCDAHPCITCCCLLKTLLVEVVAGCSSLRSSVHSVCYYIYIAIYVYIQLNVCVTLRACMTYHVEHDHCRNETCRRMCTTALSVSLQSLSLGLRHTYICIYILYRAWCMV
jgi:hypothetical protein